MLYFLHGTDTTKSFEKSGKLVDAMLAKKPDASLFKLGIDDWSLATLQELIGGQGLFEQKYIVTISRILDDKSIADDVLKLVKEISESENIFIWTEGKVDAKTLKKIEKYSEKIETHDENQTQKEEMPTAFPLTDAIASRDKKKSWLLYNNLSKKLSAEEIHGTVTWLFKSMALTTKTKTAAKSGLKPFVYSKSKKGAQNFKTNEIEDLYFKLITLSHDARRGKTELPIAMERFILEL